MTTRLFFGLDIEAAWPKNLPKAHRLIAESERHITLAFLGMRDLKEVLKEIPSLPLPPFHVGPVGLFCKPFKHPHVVAWQCDWLTNQAMNHYQKSLYEALANRQLVKNETHSFCPHVTLARPPFNKKTWSESFHPTLFSCKALHLYESLGFSTYRSHWKHSFVDAFVEIEHTADMAFIIRAHTIQELLTHATGALAFRFPELLPFCSFHTAVTSLDEIIIALNQLITTADIATGCPLKAVSFHGTIHEREHSILEWEMIVDV